MTSPILVYYSVMRVGIPYRYILVGLSDSELTLIATILNCHIIVLKNKIRRGFGFRFVNECRPAEIQDLLEVDPRGSKKNYVFGKTF